MSSAETVTACVISRTTVLMIGIMLPLSLGPAAHGVDHPGAARGAVLEGDGPDVLSVRAAVGDQFVPLLGLVGDLAAVDVVLVGLDDGRAAVFDEAPGHQVADHAVGQHE